MEKALKIIALILLVALGIAYLASPKAPPISSNMYSNEMKSMAKAMAQKFMTDRLKAPSTAEFSDSPEIEYLGDSIFIVKSYVDSQNSFGAKLRMPFEVKEKYISGEENQNWTLLSIVH